MKAEQIIYTSCRRGIAGETSGFQTYSYSQEIAQWERSNQLGTIFAQFNGSTMPSGLPILPTEQEAQTLFPKRYSYRRIEGSDKLCAATLCTYIGRDYPEDSQRSGNFLGHGLVFHEGDCDINPGLLIGSRSFMSSIDPAKVRKDERPELLQTVELIPSETVNTDVISDFLSEGNHADDYKQMLACLLNNKDERTGRVKRIFIHDTPENIQLWIASIMLAFPIKIAMNISFSTYEFDPENSSVSIVGVSKNTNYNVAKRNAGIDYYFDFFENVIDSSDFKDIEDYCEFVCDSLMYSYENLQVFHDFLNTLSYCAADKTMCDAQNFNLFVHDVLAFDDYDASQIKDVLNFALKYAGKDINRGISEKAFEYMRRTNFSDDVFGTMIRFQSSLLSSGVIEKDVMTGKLAEVCIEHFCTVSPQQNIFRKLFSMCEDVALNELRQIFLSKIEDIDVKAWWKPELVWKAAFIISLYAPYREFVREFANKDSFHCYVLKNFLNMISGVDAETADNTIKHIYEEYKKAGIESITILYFAILQSLTIASGNNVVAKWKIGFRSQLSTFSESEILKALQFLYEHGVEDDINYVVEARMNNPEDDFLGFAQLLEEHLPEYFTAYRQKLAACCYKKSNSLSSHYKILTFAVKTKKYSSTELVKMVEAVSNMVSVIGELNSQREYIDGLCDYCDALGINPYPKKVSLAALNLYLNDLCIKSSKLFSSDKKLSRQINDAIGTMQTRIDGMDIATADKYLTEIAKSVAVLILKSRIFTLQDELLVLGQQDRLQLKCKVLKQACAEAKKSRDYEPLICLIIYDIFAVNDISGNVIDILNKSGVSPSSLRKCIEKEKSMEVIDKLYNSLNIRAASTSYSFVNKLINRMEPVREGVFSKVTGFFSKNDEN